MRSIAFPAALLILGCLSAGLLSGCAGAALAGTPQPHGDGHGPAVAFGLSQNHVLIGVTTLPVTVSDADGVQRVEFRVDGQGFLVADGPALSIVRNVVLQDDKNFAGQHTIQVRAIDAAGNETNASWVYHILPF